MDILTSSAEMQKPDWETIKCKHRKVTCPNNGKVDNDGVGDKVAGSGYRISPAN